MRRPTIHTQGGNRKTLFDTSDITASGPPEVGAPARPVSPTRSQLSRNRSRLPDLTPEQVIEKAHVSLASRHDLAQALLKSDRGVEWMLARKASLSGGYTHPQFGRTATEEAGRTDVTETRQVQTLDRKLTGLVVAEAQSCFDQYRSLRERAGNEALQESSRVRYAADAVRKRRRATELLLHLVFPVQLFDDLLHELEGLAERARRLLDRLGDLESRVGVKGEDLDSTLRSQARRRHHSADDPDVEMLRAASAQYRAIRAELAEIEALSGFDPTLLPREIAAAREGRNAAASARAAIVHTNKGLARRKAISRVNSRLPKGDLEQEAMLGLLVAAEKFDPRRGCRFSTYASWWIMQAIHKAEARQDQLVHVPQRGRKLFRQVLDQSRTFQALLGREPTIEELQKALGCDLKSLGDVLHAMRDPCSLNESPSGDDSTLEEIVPDSRSLPVLAQVIKGDVIRKARKAAQKLPDREYKIAVLRFPILAEGQELLRPMRIPCEVSQERIRQIEAAALRHLLGDLPDDGRPPEE